MEFTFGVMGPGRVGSSLVAALGAAGAVCAGVYGGAHAAERAQELNVPLLTAQQLAANADVIFICVPDRLIGAAAQQLADAAADRGVALAGKYFYHVSGSAGVELLAPLAQHGAYTGSLHPLQSFAAPRGSLAGIGMAVDGDAKAQELAAQIALLLGAQPFCVPAAERAAYHAAACFCSNYVVTAVALAQQLLSRWAADEETAFKMLLPLFNGTAQNLMSASSAGQALTGPIARGDVTTVEKHLQALPQEFTAPYITLGRAAVKLAQRGGLGAAAAAEMEKLFTEAERK